MKRTVTLTDDQVELLLKALGYQEKVYGHRATFAERELISLLRTAPPHA